MDPGHRSISVLGQHACQSRRAKSFAQSSSPFPVQQMSDDGCQESVIDAGVSLASEERACGRATCRGFKLVRCLENGSGIWNGLVAQVVRAHA
jgi:hypothetical protein